MFAPSRWSARPPSVGALLETRRREDADHRRGVRGQGRSPALGLQHQRADRDRRDAGIAQQGEAGGYGSAGADHIVDQDDANAVAARLLRDGWDAQVTRERLAGEDDDEDHPWAVLTDAPAFQLELLIEEYDGWLDLDDAPAAESTASPPLHLPPPPPLELPNAPKRIKRPDQNGGQ